MGYIAETEEDIADMTAADQDFLEPLGIKVVFTDEAFCVRPDIGQLIAGGIDDMQIDNAAGLIDGI